MRKVVVTTVLLALTAGALAQSGPRPPPFRDPEDWLPLRTALTSSDPGYRSVTYSRPAAGHGRAGLAAGLAMKEARNDPSLHRFVAAFLHDQRRLAKFTEAERYALNWGLLYLKWGEARVWAVKPAEAKKPFARAGEFDSTPSEKSELQKYSTNRV